MNHWGFGLYWLNYGPPTLSPHENYNCAIVCIVYKLTLHVAEVVVKSDNLPYINSSIGGRTWTGKQ